MSSTSPSRSSHDGWVSRDRKSTIFSAVARQSASTSWRKYAPNWKLYEILCRGCWKSSYLCGVGLVSDDWILRLESVVFVRLTFFVKNPKILRIFYSTIGKITIFADKSFIIFIVVRGRLSRTSARFYSTGVQLVSYLVPFLLILPASVQFFSQIYYF